MNRQRKIVIAKSTVVLGVIPVLIYGYAEGPLPRNTGAPGDSPTACNQSGCHLGTPVNGGGGKVDITFPAGLVYVPGVKQRWTVTVTDSQATFFGFQATARLASNESNGQAGAFSPIDGTTQVLCEDGSTKSAAGCRAELPVEFVEHKLAGAKNTFTFDWTPPATDVGNVRVYVAGNGANGNGQNTGDHIYTANFTLEPAVLQGPPSIRAEQSVLQAFSNAPGLSSGTWLQIFGTNLSATSRPWSGADFDGNKAPLSLDGVRVDINGRPAFVGYVSRDQVNVQAPDDDSVGDVTVKVITPSGESNSVTLKKTKISPALLTTSAFNVGGRQYMAALHSDFRTFVGRDSMIAGVPFRPAKPGDTIILYAVGCGSSNPVSPAGQFFPEARELALPYQVRFGETVADAKGFLAAEAVGLCQFNVTVPNVADGDVRLDLTIDGASTGQTLFTTIQR